MAAQIQTALNILRRKQVEARTGLSRSTIYQMMAEEKFPKAIQLSAQSVGWLSSEIDGWINSRISASRPAK